MSKNKAKANTLAPKAGSKKRKEKMDQQTYQEEQTLSAVA